MNRECSMNTDWQYDRFGRLVVQECRIRLDTVIMELPPLPAARLAASSKLMVRHFDSLTIDPATHAHIGTREDPPSMSYSKLLIVQVFPVIAFLSK